MQKKFLTWSKKIHWHKKPAGQADGDRKKLCYASLLISLFVGYDFHGGMGKKRVLIGHRLRESSVSLSLAKKNGAKSLTLAFFQPFFLFVRYVVAYKPIGLDNSF